MYAKVFKRILDIILSIIGLIFFVIAFIIVAPLIWLEDKGPVFYNANRLGKKGKIFKMYKFRTMKVNAPDIRNKDGSTYNGDDDPRLTNIGRVLRKTSLDELPQIINVLIGNMSFIGPRPDLPEHIKEYSKEEKRKLDVLPGITGYNQAYFRNSIEWRDRLKNDIYYVDNISLVLDLKIIFKTIKTVLCKEGIYIADNSKYNLIHLDWDTNYFGIKSGKVVLNDTINNFDVKKIRKWIKNYDFITLTNLNNNNENNIMISNFKAYLADVNVQLLKMVDCNTENIKNVTITENCSEIKQLLEIAKVSYTHSRFINDSRLDKQKAKLVYYHWLKNALNKNGKIIAYYKQDNKYLGYCLFHVENSSTCVIELIAVDLKFSGQGIGSKLLDAVNDFCVKNKIEKIEVGTQLDNISAQNFYIKNGFRIISYNPTYHIWR